MGVFDWLFGSKPPVAKARVPLAQRDRDRAASPEQPRVKVLPPRLAFTPTQPKATSRQLTGRQAELRRILQAIGEDRAHVVLYSERGRGKTSLSNMVVESLRQGGMIVARYTCDAGSDFDSMLRGLVRDLPASLMANPVAGGEGCEAAFPDRVLRPGDVLVLPQRLACRGLVCLIDEFDRVTDTQTRVQLADAIKQLSDRDVPLQFLVVGVSENLDEILGQHPSIQRSVIGVHLPLFTDRDVAQLIAKGGRESGFNFLPSTVARVTVLSRGMPYMAQLLGLRLIQSASARGSTDVSDEDFDAAIARMVADANPKIVATYAALTDRGRDPEMVHTLRSVATAPQDQWGRIEVMSAAEGRVSVGGRRLLAASWAKLVDSGALAPVTGSTGLYVFAERSLMHHVLLLAAKDISSGESGDGAERQDRTIQERSNQDRSPVVLRPLASNV